MESLSLVGTRCCASKAAQQGGPTTFGNPSAYLGDVLATLSNATASPSNPSASLGNTTATRGNGIANPGNGSADLRNGFATLGDASADRGGIEQNRCFQPNQSFQSRSGRHRHCLWLRWG